MPNVTMIDYRKLFIKWLGLAPRWPDSNFSSEEMLNWDSWTSDEIEELKKIEEEVKL
jgi:hypothetical protein